MHGKRVLIVGGGVSGLSAAHELVERGFDVTIYERRSPACGHARHHEDAYGGKARSYQVATHDETPRLTRRYDRTAHASTLDGNGSYDAPAEHGFRFLPAFYRHLPETMARIPAASECLLNGDRTVADALRSPGRNQLASYRVDGPIPFVSEFPRGRDMPDTTRLLEGTKRLGLSSEDVLFYFGRLWQVLTSCKERRFRELETRSWFDFLEADKRSAAFHDYLGVGSTRNLVASRAEEANARIIAEISIQTWMPILFPRPWNFNDCGDRILAGPTQDTWIRPWIQYLGERGVDFRPNHQLVHIGMEDGEIQSLSFTTGDPNRAQRQAHLTVAREAFDLVILALPLEQITDLITAEMEERDPDLGRLKLLRHDLGWMSGIQFYLSHIPTVYQGLTGHVNFVDSPWALTAIAQSLSWDPQYQPRPHRDGFGAVLSVCVSDWKKKGFNGKTAEDCRQIEVVEEVWDEIVRALPHFGDSRLTQVRGYSLDEDVRERESGSACPGAGLQNREPLLVNKVNSWMLRPEAGTRIANLVLAGDYVRTHTGLACMEAANESARRAVNDILSRSGSTTSPCQVWELEEPVFAKFAQMRDRVRFERGSPWQDLPGSPMSVLMEGGRHVASFMAFLQSRAEP